MLKHKELEQRQAKLEVMLQTSLGLTANLELKTVLDTILNSTFTLLSQTKDAHLFFYQHQRLEKPYNSANLAQVDFGDYIRELTGYLFRAQNAQTQGISLNIQADEVFLDIDRAVPCGLILNELVSNSLKHAFPNGTGGTVHIYVHVDGDNQFSLIVGDNGIGLPQELDFRNSTTLELQLVDTLVSQLEGTVELDRSRGTNFRIMFTRS